MPWVRAFGMTVRQQYILCVHQGGELYGSDRSFLQSVAALRQAYPNAHIHVLLAADGPLASLLDSVADEVRIRDLIVLRLARLGETLVRLTIALPWFLFKAWQDSRDADLVYVNTSVIADFMLLSRFSPRRFILHVREIPRPRMLPVVRAFCRISGARILFNSAATATAFALPRSQPQQVIHNGSDPVADPHAPAPPTRFSQERPLRLSMLGRINSWKGQDLLIDAVAMLPQETRAQVQVRIVGGVYGSDQSLRDALLHRIAENQLEDIISIEPFQDDPADIYAWSDVSIVPSLLPEPFGRVAIEAMAWARPVIVAAHGGLVEIVEDGLSGWHVPPGDAPALSRRIAAIVADPTSLPAMGMGALDRFNRAFSTAAMNNRLKRTISQWMPTLGQDGVASTRPAEGLQ